MKLERELAFKILKLKMEKKIFSNKKISYTKIYWWIYLDKVITNIKELVLNLIKK